MVDVAMVPVFRYFDALRVQWRREASLLPVAISVWANPM